MFKKMKQRIEDSEHQNQTYSQSSPPMPKQNKKLILSSTPKKPSRPQLSTTNQSLSRNGGGHQTLRSESKRLNKYSRENKWEQRRMSTASLTSSRESLYSLDSSSATAPISRISYNSMGVGETSYSTIGTPVESPLIIERVRFSTHSSWVCGT